MHAEHQTETLVHGPVGFLESVFSNFIGMLSDARSLPPVIGRIIEFRALLSATLVDLYPDKSEHDLTELAHNISNRNCGKFLGLEAENR